MNEQSEALRLADELDAVITPYCLESKAAAELRRLSDENERLRQINQSHEMKLSVRGYEIQIADLEAQRDALLEALHNISLAAQDSGSTREGMGLYARAAIKAVEGEKT